MKELTIEEKAARYDKAFETARKIHSGEGVAAPPEWTTCEVIFPELAESEDEKIRKSLIDMLKNDEKCYLKEIAWLEKQGEEIDLANREYWRGYREGKQEILDKYADFGKQGEQKPAENSEKVSEYTTEEKDMTEYKKGFECGKQRVLKYPEDFGLYKNSVWREEDEKIYQSIMDDTVQENQLDDKQTNWLRDIKYRYFPQPKQEWSEEDEKQARQIERIVHNDGCTQKLQKQIADWFKSLKERCTWKPSVEQMEALETVISSLQSTALESLYSVWILEKNRRLSHRRTKTI